MYRIVDKEGRYMARDRVPVQWSPTLAAAVGWTVRSDAEHTIKRLWGTTLNWAKANFKIVWEEVP